MLSLLVFLLPFIGIGVGLLLYFSFHVKLEWCIGAGVLIAALTIFLWGPVRELRVITRRAVEYDEYGLSKSKGHYEYLSKKERDAMDLQKTADMERLLGSVAMKKMSHQGPKDPAKELNKMVGIEPVKEKVFEMVARMQFEAEENKKLSKAEIKKKGRIARHMVFFGGPGTGKTTVARIITSFLFKAKCIKENKIIEVDGNFLKAGTESATKTELLIRKALGGVLFIDEAYALMDSGDASGAQAIATLIKQMEDKRGEFVLILAGYTEEMKALLAQNPGFESRIKEYVNFPDYTDEEMQQIFVLMAEEKHLKVNPDCYQPFQNIIRKERRSDSFGNARTVRNILDKVIDKHSVNVVKGIYSNDDRYVLHGQDFEKLRLGSIGSFREFDEDSNPIIEATISGVSGVITRSEIESHIYEGVKDWRAALDNMIGLENVKNQVLQMQARMQYDKEFGSISNASNGNHMLFYGPAGTGKTSVARIMTRILFEQGYIKDNKCVEVNGQFLKGQYRGHAGKRTEAIINAAIGGVLFIDEAYVLDDADSIGVLIKSMEDYRSNFIVILAGYQKDMERLLARNEGFNSRIKTKLIFNSYNINELMQIFVKMIGEYQITQPAFNKVREVLLAKSQEPAFGNGRDVRNLIDKIIDRHAYNYQTGKIPPENAKIIILEDIPDEFDPNRRATINQDEYPSYSFSAQKPNANSKINQTDSFDRLTPQNHLKSSGLIRYNDIRKRMSAKNDFTQMNDFIQTNDSNQNQTNDSNQTSDFNIPKELDPFANIGFGGNNDNQTDAIGSINFSFPNQSVDNTAQNNEQPKNDNPNDWLEDFFK